MPIVDRVTPTDVEWSYQNSERVLGRIVYALLVLAMIDLAVQYPTWSSFVGFCVAAIGGAVAVWRMVTIRVTATAMGVNVRNFFRSYHVAWEQIAGFRYAQYGINPSIGVADLKDTRSIALAALQGPPLFPNSKRTRRAREAVDYLEQRRARQSSLPSSRRRSADSAT